MDDKTLYGDANLYTQLQPPRRTEAGGVVVPIRIDHADEEADGAPSSVEFRAVTMTAEEAREYALELLAAVGDGPSDDEFSQTFVAGSIRVTVEGPREFAYVANPLLSATPRTSEDLDRLIDALGGLPSFDTFKPSGLYPALGHTTHAIDRDHPFSLYVSVKVPQSMAEEQPSVAPALAALVERQERERERLEGEDAAADDLIASREQPKPFATEDVPGGVKG